MLTKPSTNQGDDSLIMNCCFSLYLVLVLAFEIKIAEAFCVNEI